MSEVAKCEGPECERPGPKKGLCATHFHQRYTYKKELTVIKRNSRSKPDEWYVEQERLRLKAKEESKVSSHTCSGPECDKPAASWTPRLLCRSHYMQQWSGKPLTPLRNIADSQPVDAKRRKCNTCYRIKDRDDFYTRTNGKPQTECKVCQGKRSRIDYLTRSQRHEDAADLRLEWDEYVQQGHLEAQNRA